MQMNGSLLNASAGKNNADCDQDAPQGGILLSENMGGSSYPAAGVTRSCQSDSGSDWNPAHSSKFWVNLVLIRTTI